MLIVLGAAAVALLVWAWWLVRTQRAPRWLRWVAGGVVVVTIACAGYTLYALAHAFTAVADANPADKASGLARDISHAMTVLAIGCLVAGAGAIPCAYFTLWPRKKRAHDDDHHQAPQG